MKTRQIKENELKINMVIAYHGNKDYSFVITSIDYDNREIKGIIKENGSNASIVMDKNHYSLIQY